MLFVVGLPAVVELAMVEETEGAGHNIIIFLAGVFSICFAGAGPFSLVGGIGHDLVTNRFAVAGTVEGHGVVDLVGLVIIGRVVDALVGIRVAVTLGSTRGFSNHSYFVLSLACLVGFTSFLFSPLSLLVICSSCGAGILGLSG